MKNLIATILTITTIACSTTKKNCKQDEDMYSITKIDSVDNYYVIYGKFKDDNYKLISEKTNSKCGNEVVVGKKYNLKTQSIFTMKIMVKDTVREISNNVNIKCMTLGKTIICKEYENGIYDVLKSENLQGLCYINRK